MYVLTDRYYRHAGRMPRGYWKWNFALVKRDRSQDTFSYEGMYSEAKKAAIKRAKEVGANYIEVL